MSQEIPNSQESASALAEQVGLARKLGEVTDALNAFNRAYPELEDLSVFVDGSPENKKFYENLEDAVASTRKEFDEKVSDKKALVKHLREQGEDQLAKRIVSMFGIKERSWF